MAAWRWWQTCMWPTWTDGEVRLDLDWSSCSSGPAGEWSSGKVKCVDPALTNIGRTEDQIHRSAAVVRWLQCCLLSPLEGPLDPLDPRGGSQVSTPDDVTTGKRGGDLKTEKKKEAFFTMYTGILYTW